MSVPKEATLDFDSLFITYYRRLARLLFRVTQGVLKRLLPRRFGGYIANPRP